MSDIILDQAFMEEDTQKGKFLTFVLGTEEYGIEIKYVTEIINLQPITVVPEVPVYMKGIINLRGTIIPVMDVRLRFQKPVREYNDRTCIIVIHFEDVTIGLIVDSVAEVLNIADGDIVDPPNMNQTSQRYIRGIGKVNGSVKLLLDCSKLIGDDELQQIKPNS
ncbi:purine-binding chemotaxis protein CheW [Paenibacillus antri]|uniref:Purine-binding chemotaxis protein CheW n=1 Tax=Paenibacillus antri TaxID=2582848 RepID=A0A5R9FZ84_9BACL|nr:chemotaxis protein CheW [Paenibacillus antri]TLS49372.1 purine-binding chemotaxis protein CheW [Paenibacillus antri]